MESIFLKSEPEWEIDPVDDMFSEEAIKVSPSVVNNWIGRIVCQISLRTYFHNKVVSGKCHYKILGGPMVTRTPPLFSNKWPTFIRLKNVLYSQFMYFCNYLQIMPDMVTWSISFHSKQ